MLSYTLKEYCTRRPWARRALLEMMNAAEDFQQAEMCKRINDEATYPLICPDIQAKKRADRQRDSQIPSKLLCCVVCREQMNDQRQVAGNPED